MIVGYARVSTDGQSLEAQDTALRGAGAERLYAEKQSGIKTDRAALARCLASLEAGDVLLVTKLDRLARSTRDLLNTLAAIGEAGASFKSLGDPWADTSSAHGRLMDRNRTLILEGVGIVPPISGGAAAKEYVFRIDDKSAGFIVVAAPSGTA
jgi:DNA invertase Pin-like site-specific DNA recombinase